MESFRSEISWSYLLSNYAALSVTRPDLIDLLRADKPELVAELDATIVELLQKAGD